MKKFRITLRNKISIPAFLVITTVGFLVAWGIFLYLGNILMENKLSELEKVSTQKAKEIGYIFDQNRLFIEMLGTRTRVREFLEEQSEERQIELQGIFDEYAKQHPNYLSIYLMDEGGNTLISTDRTFLGKNYEFRNYFLKAKEGEPFMEALLGKTSNQFGYYFSHPVKGNQGETIGVAVVKVDEKEIKNALLDNLSFGVDDIFLVDEDGIVLIAKDEMKTLKSLGILDEEEKKRIKESGKFSDKEIEALDYQEALNLIHGHDLTADLMASVKIYDEFDGKEEILKIFEIPSTHFFIIKELDPEDIYEQIIPVIYLISAGVFGAAFLVAIFIYLLIGFLLRNLSKINSFYERVGEGDFTKKVEITTNDELGDLARSFNLMQEGLKDYYENLKKEIFKKTEIAEKANAEMKKQQEALLNVLDDVEWEKKNVQKEKDKIDAIIHSIGDAVFVVDEKKKIILVNDITEKISGFKKEELIGSVYNKNLKFIFEKDEKENREFMDKALKTGEIQEMANHTMIIQKDGGKIPVADSAAPLKDKKGKIVGCVVVFRDVTKEREVDRMKTEFVSLASHQLRTPLTSIKWYSELLLTDEGKDKLKGEKRDFVQEIHQGNNRMIDLVNDLLNVSRIETGKKFVIDKKKMDIVPVVIQAMKDHEVLAKQKNIQLVCEKRPEGKVMLEVDSEKIQQVFHNFISNAIKYSAEGGKVFVGCYDEGDQYIFYVKDEGVGIPKDQQARIFEKFFRASNVLLTEAEGTGLGLYIAKSIVEGHGGKIWFESVEKKGTAFFMSLPKK